MTNDQLALIYPYVVPGTWVDYAGKDNLISWPVTDTVHAVLDCDLQGALRNVRPQGLELLEIDEDEAFEVAASNLSRAWHAESFSIGTATLLDGVEVGCARGSWMAPAAGLLLGNFHAALSRQFGVSEFVAVAVNQGFLIAFPDDERTLASKSLRIAIDDEFNGHRKPISREWLLLNGQWPQEYPGRQLF